MIYSARDSRTHLVDSGAADIVREVADVADAAQGVDADQLNAPLETIQALVRAGLLLRVE